MRFGHAAQDRLVTFLVAIYSASVFTTNGCASPTEPTPRETAVSGRVTDAATGSPIAGATVTILTSARTTDANGFYRIPGLTPGQLSMRVEAAGYETRTLEFDVREGENPRNVELNRR